MTAAPGGWWRRNRWGLVALGPALVVGLGLMVGTGGWDLYWRAEPRQPVTAGAGGWVEYAQARVRLVEVARTVPVDWSGQPLSLPEGAWAWRVTLDFDAPDPERLVGCELVLEDSAGRIFDTGAAELTGADTPLGGCVPESEETGPGYRTASYFVTPESIRPAAVRLWLRSELPRYVRLPAAGPAAGGSPAGGPAGG